MSRDPHFDKHVFRGDLLPDQNDALRIGRSGLRFLEVRAQTGQFAEVVTPLATVDTLVLGGSTLTGGTLTITAGAGLSGGGTVALGGSVSLALIVPVSVARGGTGLTSYTVGDLLLADGATSLTALADVADGNVLRSGGIGTAPLYGKVRLSGATTDITGTLGVASGGTGLTAGTSGGVLAFTATGTLASSAALTANALVVGGGAGVVPTVLASLGTTTTVLHGNAAGAPTWGAISLTADVAGTLGVANGGTGLTTGTSGGVLGFTAAGTLASSVALTANALVLGGGAGATPTVLGSLGTTTTVLHGNAAGAPTWASVSLTADVAGTLGVANGGTGLTAGTSGGILAFTATGTLASSALLTASALIIGGGAGVAPSSLALGTANRVLGMNAGATAHEYKTLASADASVTITHTANNIDLAAAAGAWTKMGSTSVEQTTTSTTEVDVLSLSVTSIAVGRPILIICGLRKSAGAANAAFVGLKLNATAVRGTLNTGGWSSTLNQAESGVARFYIPAQETSYLRSGVMETNVGDAASTAGKSWGFDGDMPNAAITTVVILGKVDNAAITLGVDNVSVFAGAAV